MNTSKFNNALLRVALSLLLIAVQACGTAQKYQNLSGEPVRENGQASLQLISIDHIGKAKGFQLLSVNGAESRVLPGNETKIPSGIVHLKVEVKWSNEIVEQLKTEFDAEAEAVYRLAIFELAEPPEEPHPTYPSSPPDTLGDAMLEGAGMGLFIALLPWIIVTSPIWIPIGLALEDERPFPDCCFVWVARVNGELASGEAPPESSDFRPSQQTQKGEFDELCLDADSGEVDALYRIGDLYWFGTQPVKQNFLRAYVWYSLAAAKGHVWAEKAVIRTREHLTVTELVEAEDLVKSWGPGQCQMELYPARAEQ